MSQRTVVVFGGSGFLGGYVAYELAKSGFAVKIVSRTPEMAERVKPAGPLGQIVCVKGNIRNEESIRACVQGAYAVVNLVGVAYERGEQDFSLHSQGAERLTKAAAAAHVKKFVHVSALGVDKPTKSKYARTKRTGEKAVVEAYPTATILRPSVLFGPGDSFFSRFAHMARVSPFLPLIGGGSTKFQPVYAGDVAKAIAYALTHEECAGRIYELGGPEVRTFRELMEILLEQLKKKRLLLPIPYSIASLQAFFLEALPTPPLTRDQVRLLKIDNVVETDSKAGKFSDMHIHPVPIESVLSSYIK